MQIFIDTEFTALAREASLISFGAVSEDGREFYCEVTPVVAEECSGFVREIVLPLLEGGAAACPRRRFAERLAAWLGQFEDPVLLSDSDWDIYVVRHAVSGERSRLPGRLALPGPAGPLEVMLLMLAPLAPAAMAIFEREITQHFARDNRQHHALVDAKALREGLLAIVSTPETG
ncbi:MAG: 3'-5' exoribonuclease [Dechloromonas sp.]|nr:MAG: 3'-5' exoribonuclease [Dechloromonas sp.]